MHNVFNCLLCSLFATHLHFFASVQVTFWTGGGHNNGYTRSTPGITIEHLHNILSFFRLFLSLHYLALYSISNILAFSEGKRNATL